MPATLHAKRGRAHTRPAFDIPDAGHDAGT
jgi:hypothetical protein